MWLNLTVVTLRREPCADPASNGPHPSVWITKRPCYFSEKPCLQGFFYLRNNPRSPVNLPMPVYTIINSVVGAMARGGRMGRAISKNLRWDGSIIVEPRTVDLLAFFVPREGLRVSGAFAASLPWVVYTRHSAPPLLTLRISTRIERCRLPIFLALPTITPTRVTRLTITAWWRAWSMSWA
jgi:hypothetical protein